MKVLVVGNGFGRNAMAPAYRALGCDVDVMTSRDVGAIEAACHKAPDLVSIHSPPFDHRQLVLAALAEGCNVLCDKPFGSNATDARAMRDAAQDSGALHFLNFEFRSQPAWCKARDLVAEGRIGTLTHANIISFGSGMRERDHGWIFEGDKAGGWIGAYGSHLIDGLRWFFDAEILDCGGLARSEVPFHPDANQRPVRSTAEDAFTCWLRFSGGGTANIDTGYAAAVTLPSSFHLLGSEGAISISSETALSLHRAGSPAEQFDFAPKPGEPQFSALAKWLSLVLTSIREGRQIAPNFDDGVAVAEVMEALKSSAVRSGF